ncbi:MAG: CPBP family intramembrane glutamic endopeptidase [Bacteroidota bacterium]
MDSGKSTRKLLLFIIITYVFSWTLWIPVALLKNGITFHENLEIFFSSPFNPAAFGPFFAAVVLTLFTDGWKGGGKLLKRSIDFHFIKKWILPTLLLLPLIFGGGIVLSILLDATEKDFSVISNPPYAIVAFFVIMFTAGPLQEEFGWRGFALPRLLSHFNALTSSLILGFFWWLWHLPTVFIPGAFMTSNLFLFAGLAPVIMFTSILFTWIYNNTNGSLFPALLMHASMNWSIWLFIPAMTINWTIIGFWIFLLAISVLILIRRWGVTLLDPLDKTKT